MQKERNNLLFPSANHHAYCALLRRCYRGQGNSAAQEFQKILDHRGIAPVVPIGALAHLGLARAHVMAGDTTGARTAYQDFLALWKEADPEIPILKEPKSEYKRLQQ